MNAFRIGLVVTALLVSACAASKVASYKDPSAPSDYQNLVVVAGNLPLEQRAEAEKTMVEKAGAHSVQAIPGMSVLPPTRELSSEAISAAISSSGADAVMMMWAIDYSLNEVYVPPTVISPGSSVTTGTITGYGNSYTLNTTTTYNPPSIFGGFTVSKPTAQYGAALYDVETGKRVWVAEISSRGNAFADYTDLARSAAAEAIRKLAEDGLIPASKG